MIALLRDIFKKHTPNRIIEWMRKPIKTATSQWLVK